MTVFSQSMQDCMDDAERVRASYESKSPFPHVVLHDVCKSEVLRGVREEIIANFQATYKETDLFKMLQSMVRPHACTEASKLAAHELTALLHTRRHIMPTYPPTFLICSPQDLANLSSVDEATKSKIPNLLALRDAIYSPEFRDFVSSVTGCGTLSETTDCACNIHPIGGHLLTHDDVIGDRRVSYIIYLTDPDDPWTADDGGALELYPEDPNAPLQPYPIPSASALPVFNSMAMFKVEAGKSFHSIQEVFTSEKPRMSLQGWFHGPLPEAETKALPTLAMLQTSMAEKDLGQFRAFDVGSSNSELVTGEAAPYVLSDEDVRYLTPWINPLYLDGRGTAKLQKAFEEDGSIHLLHVLSDAKAAAIKAAMLAVDAKDGVGEGRRPAYEVGMTEGWKLRGPAHMQRYLAFSRGGDDDNGEVAGTRPGGNDAGHGALGVLLQDVYDNLIASVPFANLIRTFTTLSMVGCQGEVRRFRPGLDYTVAHYGVLTTDPRLDVVLTFVNEDKMSSASWADGECGGFEAYLLADDEEDGPAEVYRNVQDDDSGVLNVSACFNALSIVLRDEGLMRFVKYVSSTAPGSRWDVSAVMLPVDDDDESDDQ